MHTAYDNRNFMSTHAEKSVCYMHTAYAYKNWCEIANMSLCLNFIDISDGGGIPYSRIRNRGGEVRVAKLQLTCKSLLQE